VQGPDLFLDPDPPAPTPPPSAVHARTRPEGIWAAGDRIAWLSGLILALSAFMDWYAGSSVGVTLSVIGWHTGLLGKLVFFIGLAVVALVVLRESGIDLPPSTPESLVILALGVLAAVFVLIRVISIPDAVLPADGRGVGIWIALLASLGVIAGGLLRAAEDL
jgi:hypothetical protein